jgi:ABC-type multidrug transport system fused ATPase/permease subunit
MNRLVRLTLSRRQRWAIPGLVSLLLLGAAAESSLYLLLVPLAQALATSNSTINRQLGPFSAEASPQTLVWLMVILLVVLTVARLAAIWLQAGLTASVERSERERLYEAYLGAEWAEQAAEPLGRLQTVASFSTAKADRLGLLVNSTRFALNVIAMLGAALLVAPLGALAILVIGGLLFAGFRPLVAASRTASTVYVEHATRQDQDVAELVSISSEVKVFGAGESFRRRLAASTQAAIVAKKRSTILSGFTAPVYQAIGLGVAIMILGYAAVADVDVPALGAVAILLIRALAYSQGLQATIQKLAEYGPAVEYLESWHNRYADSTVTSGSDVLTSIEEIQLRDIGYRYGDDGAALQSVCVDLRPGDHVGVIGPSGAGKSTLVQIILRLRRPTTGSYSLNGVPVSAVSEESLRSLVALVPQHARIFRGTVRENVAFFRASIGPADVERACVRAGVSEAVEALPDGYDTMIGPSYRDLSGGQLQRIGIARALAGSPRLLVMDEPTSSLDVDSELLITDTLQALDPDVIVVVVAHRVSTLRHCNRLVVLEDGLVTAQGTPSQVQQSSEFYRRALESGQATLDAGDAR